MNNSKMNIAPLVVFSYNRVDHITRTLEALNNNFLASETDLYIFSDGGKNDIDNVKVNEVRKYLDDFILNNNFKNVEISKSEKNKGLANSVIYGVTHVVNKYGKVIVVEDDLVVTKDFLKYMNEGLDFYENDNKIWSITGWRPNIDGLDSDDHDIFLGYRGASWSYGTWANRWNKVDFDVKDYDEFLNNTTLQNNLNMGGRDCSPILKAQMNGMIDTWDVQWCYTQSKLNMFTIYPKNSKVFNIGNDGSGTHTGNIDRYDTELIEGNVEFCSIELNNEITEGFYHFLVGATSIFENRHNYKIRMLSDSIIRSFISKSKKIAFYGLGETTDHLLMNLYVNSKDNFNNIPYIFDMREEMIGQNFQVQDSIIPIKELTKDTEIDFDIILIGSINDNAEIIYDRIKWIEEKGVKLVKINNLY